MVFNKACLCYCFKKRRDSMAKQLFRSKTNCKIAGVCGGLGEFFDIDPIFFRATFLISILCGGLGFLIYLMMWILMPQATHE